MAVTFGCAWMLGCGYSEEQMQEKRTRISELETELEALKTKEGELGDRIAALESQNSELGSRLQSQGEEVGNLQTNLTETQRALAQLRERERQQEERLAVFRQMVAKFKAMIDSGRLRVRVVRNRMVVELPDNVLFDSGQAQLKPEGQAALTEVAAVLKTIEGRQFQVAGHTDNVPIRNARFPSNWHLSTARALTVTTFLVTEGIDATKISASGYGETQPVAGNDTDEHRAQNRRIEIVLLPNLDELPDLSSLSE